MVACVVCWVFSSVVILLDVVVLVGEEVELELSVSEVVVGVTKLVVDESELAVSVV